MNVRILIAHHLSPLGSSTNGKPYQCLPYQEVEDNVLTRFIPLGVWNEHNNRIFNNIQTPIMQLLDRVKYHSLWWLKVNNATFMYGFYRWWSDPMICLGID
ncbi:hypothetical protein MTR_7g022630 [Medicago truncatula]|uniref:Uncharacterized protein n=1 Tax=Medicago truncatula TaxID=3880 RepID=G7KUT9_MEDTR|nr:hypothetical protein MTR_7g022630 [Medicago truncatula]